MSKDAMLFGVQGASSSTPDLTFGRYEALFRIAKGGMAEVFAARIRGEGGFQKLVAVKRMLPHLAESETFVAMFLDEARVAAHVSSPHVVQTLDLGRGDDGALYIVMELVLGVTLSALGRNVARQRKLFPLPIVIELIAQAAQGLDDAHRAATPAGRPLHIVHRDVSPQNLLVGVDGRVRVTDFGIARALLRQTHTVAGEMKGKFAYFSPEQANSQPLDRRADVFSLGIVAWEAITGQGLFHADDPIATMERVRTLDIAPPKQPRPDVPQTLSDVVARALQRAPDERFATAADFARALRQVALDEQLVCAPAEVGEFVHEFGGRTLKHMLAEIEAATGEHQPATHTQRSSHAREKARPLPASGWEQPAVEAPVVHRSGAARSQPGAWSKEPTEVDSAPVWDSEPPRKKERGPARARSHSGYQRRQPEPSELEVDRAAAEAPDAKPRAAKRSRRKLGWPIAIGVVAVLMAAMLLGQLLSTMESNGPKVVPLERPERSASASERDSMKTPPPNQGALQPPASSAEEEARLEPESVKADAPSVEQNKKDKEALEARRAAERRERQVRAREAIQRDRQSDGRASRRPSRPTAKSREPDTSEPDAEKFQGGVVGVGAFDRELEEQ